MISDTNAVIEPWAVVIEPLNTAITDSAVAGARCAQNHAVRTHLTRMDVLEKLEEVVCWTYVSRICSGCDEETENDKGCQSGNGIGQVIALLVWKHDEKLACHHKDKEEDEEHLSLVILTYRHQRHSSHKTLQVDRFGKHTS